MRIGTRQACMAIASASLIIAAAAPTFAQSPSAGAASWPISGPLKDGSTFTLAQSIQDKLTSGADINYVFSYQSPSIPLFSDQYKAGYETSLPQAQQILTTLKGQIIAPTTGPTGIDVPAQVAQIQALLDTNSVDCLSIEPPDSNAFTAITNQAMAAGIPVFTVGVSSNGNELTNFTQISEKEGHQAAQIVADWIKSSGTDVKTFAVSGGDTVQNWAQGRMKGFHEAIMAAIPDGQLCPSTCLSPRFLSHCARACLLECEHAACHQLRPARRPARRPRESRKTPCRSACAKPRPINQMMHSMRRSARVFAPFAWCCGGAMAAR